MRYDSRVRFITHDRGYNPETGDYETRDVCTDIAWASVAAASQETIQLVYDGPKQGALTIHLQGRKTRAFDFIEIDGKRYRADFYRGQRNREAYTLSEV